ncbi:MULTISPECIES: hypothetical protein [Burkholderia]|nr:MULTISPECIES: hypothetical protein [Burkholderia]
MIGLDISCLEGYRMGPFVIQSFGCRRLYQPMQQFVKSAAQMEMHLPLDFDVRIEESNFQEQFFSRINRQVWRTQRPGLCDVSPPLSSTTL